ncbi:hypothetical protein QBC32DRAFT_34794 [Pseudoneurospora amorphoporcata]|uniref:Uncharacterized protein n=1 Tax=Pseudoneurospora amorphoporcata TaxID=241081 RepID=A0AAN6P0V6_9PEZI|nr:hypothetical protein QBC32DRAFT_34794 [Pseudoneurospora amorphoporcata]
MSLDYSSSLILGHSGLTHPLLEVFVFHFLIFLVFFLPLLVLSPPLLLLLILTLRLPVCELLWFLMACHQTPEMTLASSSMISNSGYQWTLRLSSPAYPPP